MKKSTLNWMLAALLGLATLSSFIRTGEKLKPEQDSTLYYWYDASMTYLNRQRTIANEMTLTGFNESMSNPKTLQEYGFAPSGVTATPFPPTPNTPSNPDKRLFSHP